MQIELPHPLSHAYLITGSTHAGRLEAAQRFTQAYLCTEENPPCGSCRACRKVAEGIHPDVIPVGILKDKTAISVEQARALRSDAYIVPNEGARKVYIIDPADALAPEAQGALLKILEDGPSYAAFLLLAEEGNLLLETIRSRCEPFHLPPEEEVIDPALLEQAESLASLLLLGDEYEVVTGLAALEKAVDSANALNKLLQITEGKLSYTAAVSAERIIRVRRILKTCREDAVYNLSAGLTLGRIAAEIFR